MIKYRKLTDLTDEEVEYIMQDIFATDTVTNIVRFERSDSIDCDIHLMDYDDGSPHYDTITLCNSDDEFPLSTSEFDITDDEMTKYLQYLIAKGIDWRFKDNPYLTE